MDAEQKKLRRSVLRLVALATILFFALLLLFAELRVYVPQRRLQRLDELLAAGETDAVRRLAPRLGDEAAAESYLERCSYLDAESAFARGDWLAARELFAAAGSWEDSAEKVRLCDYRRAEELRADCRFEEAEELFSSLGGYGDAADRALDCRYDRAAALEGSGELNEAAALFDTLGAYRDAADRLLHIARTATGLTDDEEALAAFRGMSPEARAKMVALGAAREALPQGVIAVGFYHTVGLRADGTVAACGDNSCGQCEVAALHDVTAVAAGAYHTVVLHSDGTVSALGRNSEQQCETSSWRNVTAIAASDYASFGLTEEGRLLCTGFYDYSEPREWPGLSAVAGGSYNLAALRADGTVWTYPKLKDSDRLHGCLCLDVNTGYAVGVMPDGSVVSSAFDLSSWQDVVAVSASGTAILALDVQGRVLSHFFRACDAQDFSSFTDVKAIAAGGTHFALVLADGSVKVLGENGHGEAQTDGWILAVD
ncbi:MAG: RCC1 domain-containing protein [Clostridia bacterium]